MTALLLASLSVSCVLAFLWLRARDDAEWCGRAWREAERMCEAYRREVLRLKGLR